MRNVILILKTSLAPFHIGRSYLKRQILETSQIPMRLINIYCLLLVIVFSSCSKRNLVYFSDIDSQSNFSTRIPEMIEPRMQPDDLLKITVSSLSPESNLLFNSGVLNSDGYRLNQTETINEGYLI